MNGRQQFMRVELPLALPIILAGIHIATVTIIGIGAVAALINAGGNGRLLFDGVVQGNDQKIIAGCITEATRAGVANLVLSFLERRASYTIYGEER